MSPRTQFLYDLLGWVELAGAVIMFIALFWAAAALAGEAER